MSIRLKKCDGVRGKWIRICQLGNLHSKSHWFEAYFTYTYALHPYTNIILQSYRQPSVLVFAFSLVIIAGFPRYFLLKHVTQPCPILENISLIKSKPQIKKICNTWKCTNNSISCTKKRQEGDRRQTTFYRENQQKDMQVTKWI